MNDVGLYLQLFAREKCVIYVICAYFFIVVSNTYYVVFLFCLSSACAPHVASFCGFFFVCFLFFFLWLLYCLSFVFLSLAIILSVICFSFCGYYIICYLFFFLNDRQKNRQRKKNKRQTIK
jgi:hypothetical protein